MATRVEVKSPVGTIGADIVETMGEYHILFSGSYLSETYFDKQEAIDVAERVLMSLADGNVDAVFSANAESWEKSIQARGQVWDVAIKDSDYTPDELPTGWDAQDHKAMYE